MTRERIAVGILLLIAVALRIIYLLAYSQLPEWAGLSVDNYYHHHWALDIASGNILGDTTYFRAPGYAWLLGLAYAVFGGSLWTARLLGLLIGVGTVLGTYLLGKRVAGHRAGLIAGALYAFYPLSYYFEGELLLDPLFTFLLVVSINLFARFVQTLQMRDAILAGAVFGLAVITRPTVLALLPLSLVVYLFVPRAKRPRFGVAAAFLAMALLPSVATFVRNVAIAGDPVLVSSQGGINLYIGNNPEADGISAVMPEPLGHNWEIRQIEAIAEKAQGRRMKPSELSSYWNDRAIEWILDHPGDFISLTLQKLYRQFSNVEISNNRDLAAFFSRVPLLGFNPLTFGAIFILAGIGVVFARREAGAAWLIVIAIALYIVVTSVFFFNSRFRLPLIPLYAVLGGLGVSALWGIIRQRSYRALTGSASAALITAVLTFVPWIPLSPGGSSQHWTSLGHYYYAENNLEKSLEYHRHALAIDPTFAENNLNVGVVYFRMSQADSARKYFEREIELHTDRPKAYTNLASLALLSGEKELAVRLVDRSRGLAPYDITANMVYFRALLSGSGISADSVVSQLSKAIVEIDSNVYALSDIGENLMQAQMFDAAEKALRAAVESAPPPIEIDDAAFHPNFSNSKATWRQAKGKALSLLCYLRGRKEMYRDAIKYGLAAVEHDPGLVDAHINLVSAYLAAGRRIEADSVVTVALGLFPENEALHRMKRIIGL